MIGFVPQKAVLFTGTIRENMQYGAPNATDEEIWQALEIAQAKAFVSELAEGLDSHVEQGGGNFSGGQRQRLAIARALVKPADVYVFDDSFSALDFKTDANLRKALKRADDGCNCRFSSPTCKYGYGSIDNFSIRRREISW